MTTQITKTATAAPSPISPPVAAARERVGSPIRTSTQSSGASTSSRMTNLGTFLSGEWGHGLRRFTQKLLPFPLVKIAN